MGLYTRGRGGTQDRARIRIANANVSAPNKSSLIVSVDQAFFRNIRYTFSTIDYFPI